MSHKLTKKTTLQVTEKNNTQQATITIPKDQLELLGWGKGEQLTATLIIGSPKLMIEQEVKR